MKIFTAACACMLSLCSHVWLFSTLWTVACQASLSMGILRKEYWSGLPCPTPKHLSDSGTEPVSLTSLVLTGEFFTTSTTKEALTIVYSMPNLDVIENERKILCFQRACILVTELAMNKQGYDTLTSKDYCK